MPYVTYVEFNVPDLEKARDFYSAVFGWDPQPFGGEDYYSVSHGDEPGIDTGLAKSQDGQPLTVATITVESVDALAAKVVENGGEIVVEKFAIPYVGYAAYFKDPNGIIVGLHEYNPEVRE